MSETALQVFTEKSIELAPLARGDVQQQIDQMLAGSGITARQLLLDLGAYLTANPKVARQATPESLFNVFYQAARLHTSFGDGGLWIIPGIAQDDEEEGRQAARGKGVRAQESKKHIIKCAREGRNLPHGWAISSYLVWKDNEPIEIERNEAGEIVGLLLAPGNPFGEHPISEVIGAVAVAEQIGESPDPKRKIMLISRQRLDEMKNHSAAAKKGKAPAWRDDPTEMYRGSAEAAMARRLCPIRFKSPGMVGGMAPPVEYELDEPESRPAISGTRGMIEDLESRAIPAEPIKIAESDSQTGQGPHPGAPRIQTDQAAGLRQAMATERATGAALTLLCPKPGDLSTGTRAFLEAKDMNPPYAMWRDMQSAFLQLETTPDSLMLALDDKRESWLQHPVKKGQNTAATAALGEIRAIFWTRAAEAGYPQAEPK